jgi:hypothetical protein
MITLFIIIGIYTIECLGSSCYSIDRLSVDTAIAVGLAELIYEIPNIIKIYKKRDDDNEY